LVQLVGYSDTPDMGMIWPYVRFFSCSSEKSRSSLSAN
jgi:hypothetical protein